jgi:type IV pilus assembly protein PilA
MGQGTGKPRSDDGFTMVELIIVILVLGILVGIAVPSFLWHRHTAQDRAAQASLKYALTAARAEYIDPTSFTGLDAALMNQVEPSIKFVDESTSSTAPYMVSVLPVSDDQWMAAAKSDSGDCFAIMDTMPGGTSFGTVADAPCTADHAVTDGVFVSEGWA